MLDLSTLHPFDGEHPSAIAPLVFKENAAKEATWKSFCNGARAQEQFNKKMRAHEQNLGNMSCLQRILIN